MYYSAVSQSWCKFEQQQHLLGAVCLLPSCSLSTVTEINCGISIPQCGSLQRFPALSETSSVFTEDQCELGAPWKHCFFPDGQQTVMETQGGMLVLKEEKCLVACEAFRHKGSLSKCTKTALWLIHSPLFNEWKTKQAACAFLSTKAHTDSQMAYLGYKSCIPMGFISSQPSTATLDAHQIQFSVLLLPSHQNWPEF